MQIHVSGRKLSVGDALRTHVSDRLNAIVEKYFDRAIEAHVTVGKEGHAFKVECALHVRQGIHLQSQGTGGDAHSAFDAAADKIEKQLRRYKRRLKDRHLSGRHGEQEAQALIAQAYVLAPEDDADDGAAAAGDGADQPVIIAETRTPIPHVSVGDAVMMMDLQDTPALMFRNRRNGQFNVVYRRPDGNIGWIDPAEAKEAGRPGR